MRRAVTRFISCCLLFSVAACFALAKEKNVNGRLTGTYTNMRSMPDGTFGQELKIVSTRKGYQGALQLADGMLGELTVVDVKIDGKDISFTIPNTSDSPGGAEFVGTIENNEICGELRSNTAGTKTVTLRKGKSYWD